MVGVFRGFIGETIPLLRIWMGWEKRDEWDLGWDTDLWMDMGYKGLFYYST
jgi:hypothetical protein